MDNDRAMNFIRRNKPTGWVDEDVDAVGFYLERRNPGFGIWEDDKLDTDKVRRVITYRNEDGRPLILGKGSSRQDVHTTSKLLSFLERETETKMQYIFPEELMNRTSKESRIYTGRNFKGVDGDYKTRSSIIQSLSGILKGFHDVVNNSWNPLGNTGDWSFTLGDGKLGVACIETSDASGKGRGGSYSMLIIEGNGAGEIAKEIAGGTSYDASFGDGHAKEELFLADAGGMGYVKENGRYVNLGEIETESYETLTEKCGGVDPTTLSGYLSSIMSLTKFLGYSQIEIAGHRMAKKGKNYALYK
jgi:hypothetical protein